jgi:hypothetical protein
MVAVFLVFTHVLCHVSFSRCTSILSFDIILYLLQFFVLICNGQEPILLGGGSMSQVIRYDSSTRVSTRVLQS